MWIDFRDGLLNTNQVAFFALDEHKGAWKIVAYNSDREVIATEYYGNNPKEVHAALEKLESKLIK